jgi:hypothetical protein
MTAEDKFLPLPSEWFKVRLDRLSDNGHFLILSLTNDVEVVCIPKAISESPGGHKLCLAPGSNGVARLEIVDGRFRALEAQFEGTSPVEEIGRAVRWDDNRLRGWIQRQCGDWLYVASSNGQEGAYGVIGVGDWVRFKIERSKSRSGYVGVAAHKIDAPKAQGEK